MLNTEELLLITMEHPFFRSYVAHDSPFDGVGFALNGFNGFEEFKRRPDAMKALCGVYFIEDFNKIQAMTDSAAMGAYSLKWIGVELMMCNDALLSQMSPQEKTDFLKRLHSQLLVKLPYRVVFGSISDAVSAHIFDKVMRSLGTGILESDFEPETIRPFQERLVVRSAYPIELLLSKFDEYVRNH